MGVNQVYYGPISSNTEFLPIEMSTCMLLFILKMNENLIYTNLKIQSLLKSIRKNILFIINNDQFTRFLSSKMRFRKVYQNIFNKNQKYQNII